MDKTTMLELLVKVSDKVKDYWKKDEKGQFRIEDSMRPLYADKIKELMNKAVYDDENDEHSKKDIASYIHLSPSMFSKIINNYEDVKTKNLENVLKPILRCLTIEGNLADDEMKKRVGNLLFLIFRRKEVWRITKHFTIQPEISEDDLAQRSSMYWHQQQEGVIFGNLEQTQDISSEDYFIDGVIMEEEMEFYIDTDMLFNEYRTEDGSKRHVVIFDVKSINSEYLYQRIRCLQRKDNVFAVLMVEKGECCDDIDFYRDEHSNIMMIEYEKVWEENSKICSYNYLSGNCLAWYDEKCKAFMIEGIDKICDSHK